MDLDIRHGDGDKSQENVLRKRKNVRSHYSDTASPGKCPINPGGCPINPGK